MGTYCMHQIQSIRSTVVLDTKSDGQTEGRRTDGRQTGRWMDGWINGQMFGERQVNGWRPVD